MRRAPLLLTLAVTVTMSACSASISIGQHPQPSDDCPGGPNGCSVAEHNALTGALPPVAVDVSGQIHDYILAHPEVIAEAQRGLATKQAAERQAQSKKVLAENHDAVFNDPTDPVIGNPHGDVTIVEAFDDECPWCKKLAPEIDELIKADPNVRVVLKEFPILGPMSETASKYALASLRQGQTKYAAFHAELMASPIQEHQLTEANIVEFAKKAGLDVVRLKVDAADPAIATKIAANRALVQKIGITGTPGLVIGDQVQGGGMTLDGLKMAVAAARAHKVAMAQ